ncbi:M50 family metallopeptidase [Cohnella algarum]|uniref:M50 family metallopeptidase n=1 Tax=Cohnella algarum TaxID=2044859 RepID=UPI001967359E|nr:M50 family metallopeptidase [Cohnella algarum]MBN2979846.1 M50 family metallopeptidase [Cohnella algarum]
MNKWALTVIYLLACAFLTRLIPFSSFFRTVDTLVHEFGHAAVTLLMSGRVLSIELHADHSGLTRSLLQGQWKFVPVTLAGYIAASLFAVLLFWLYDRGRLRTGLAVCSSIALATLVFFVRSGYGTTWLIGFVALNLAVLLIRKAWLTKTYYLLVAFLSLEESVLGPAFLVYASVTRPAASGDAYGMQNLTGVPAVAWALLFLGVALLCARSSLRLFLKRRTAQANE